MKRSGSTSKPRIIEDQLRRCLNAPSSFAPKAFPNNHIISSFQITIVGEMNNVSVLLRIKKPNSTAAVDNKKRLASTRHDRQHLTSQTLILWQLDGMNASYPFWILCELDDQLIGFGASGSVFDHSLHCLVRISFRLIRSRERKALLELGDLLGEPRTSFGLPGSKNPRKGRIKVETVGR